MSQRRDLSESDKRMIRLHIEWLRRRGIADATRRHRREALRRLAEVLPCPLLEASEEILDAWQAGLSVCLSSVATYTSHVRGFFDWCESAGHLPASPARQLPMARVLRQPRPMPEPEYELALGCAPEPIRTWLLLSGYMGLRTAEIASMTREGVTEIAGRLVIGGLGKGGKPFRLPVPTEVAHSLRPHLHGSGPLWRTAEGGPIPPDRLGATVAKWLRSIGLDYTLHTLRHRFCTQLYAATRDLALVQDVARHGSPATTRQYVATGGEAAAAAMDQLASRLRPRPRKSARSR